MTSGLLQNCLSAKLLLTQAKTCSPFGATEFVEQGVWKAGTGMRGLHIKVLKAACSLTYSTNRKAWKACRYAYTYVHHAEQPRAWESDSEGAGGSSSSFEAMNSSRAVLHGSAGTTKSLTIVGWIDSISLVRERSSSSTLPSWRHTLQVHRNFMLPKISCRLP